MQICWFSEAPFVLSETLCLAREARAPDHREDFRQVDEPPRDSRRARSDAVDRRQRGSKAGFVTVSRPLSEEPAPADLSNACERPQAWPRCCNGCRAARIRPRTMRPRVRYSTRVTQRATDDEPSGSRCGANETEGPAAPKPEAIHEGLQRGVASSDCGDEARPRAVDERNMPLLGRHQLRRDDQHGPKRKVGYKLRPWKVPRGRPGTPHAGRTVRSRGSGRIDLGMGDGYG